MLPFRSTELPNNLPTSNFHFKLTHCFQKFPEILLTMETRTVHMWGYLPAALPQRSPLVSPVEVNLPPSTDAGRFWTDVCGGGCGFAMAISDTGKLITWGATDDLGQSYVTSGRHGETPEPFPLPNEVSVVKAAAGWAHCVCVTVAGEVYTWGWKECVPFGTVVGDPYTDQDPETDLLDQEGSRSTDVVATHEGTKRRRVTRHAGESSSSGDESLTALPCLVAFMNPGVKITTVAAGGRHTLALSDMGQVWGWGYGGEGQLGLGSRIRMASSPRPIPCIGTSPLRTILEIILEELLAEEDTVPCWGISDFWLGPLWTGHLCGQGSADDELSPTCVSSLLGIRIDGVAAGLWHTICISSDGAVYAFGGNQFGQLGTGTDHAETLPRLLDDPSLENEHARVVSCGARHSAIVTDEKVFCWGWNKYGQLGLGDVVDRNVPSQVELDGYVPRAVACGWWHTLVLADSLT
ncbi:putative regulator of chromosome condensation 1/beta-lactamase-inhibitor protein II [Helianthus annuus]|nr:putative regulator of chromosome condensation 1/beta-lactamase-inhibitor protein II [Helianthus annuus]